MEGEIIECDRILKHGKYTWSSSEAKPRDIYSSLGLYGCDRRQATCRLDFHEKQDDLEIIHDSGQGGGGLLGETALLTHMGIQRSSDRSWAGLVLMTLTAFSGAGRIIPQTDPKTMADAFWPLWVFLNLSWFRSIFFVFFFFFFKDILLATDPQDHRRCGLIYERMKIIIEPSALCRLALYSP